MRFYRRRDPEDIIIPVYLAAVRAGDRVGKLGDIKYVYYLSNNTFTQAPGVYAETSSGRITCDAGQGILTISLQTEGYYIFTLSYDATLSQTIETVQGNYYFVIPTNAVFVALEDGTIMTTLLDSYDDSFEYPTATTAVLRSMYGLNLQIQTRM